MSYRKLEVGNVVMLSGLGVVFNDNAWSIGVVERFTTWNSIKCYVVRAGFARSNGEVMVLSVYRFREELFYIGRL